MRHSWEGYAKHAWGFDELMPLTQSGKNTFGGLGATIVDSLDTLWLMGLMDEFKAARDWIVNELSFNKCAPRQVLGFLALKQLTSDIVRWPHGWLSNLAEAVLLGSYWVNSVENGTWMASPRDGCVLV